MKVIFRWVQNRHHEPVFLSVHSSPNFIIFVYIMKLLYIPTHPPIRNPRYALIYIHSIANKVTHNYQQKLLKYLSHHFIFIRSLHFLCVISE